MAMVHYRDGRGRFEFDYDDQMFEKTPYHSNYGPLRFKKDYKGPIDLPKGCSNLAYMFKDCDLTGCYFRDFDTSEVKDMHGMFENCILPDNFSLGDKFDTSNVIYMAHMFSYCKPSKNFSLGDKFDTSNIGNMEYMFHCCRLPEDFSFGDKFDTSKVKCMRHMFSYCNLPYSLGDKFDTSKVEDMSHMFEFSNPPDVQNLSGFYEYYNISLGDKFDTSSVENMESMFAYMPNVPDLGDKFDTSKVKNMKSMFEHSRFHKGFNLGDKFDTSNAENMAKMFCGIEINDDFSIGDKFDISKAYVRDIFSCRINNPKVLADIVVKLSADATMDCHTKSYIWDAHMSLYGGNDDIFHSARYKLEYEKLKNDVRNKEKQVSVDRDVIDN